MTRARLIAPVVAIIGWRAAALLKDNTAFLRRAGLLEETRPRRRPRTGNHRSLIVRADGSGELARFTPGTTARRLGAAIGEHTTT